MWNSSQQLPGQMRSSKCELLWFIFYSTILKTCNVFIQSPFPHALPTELHVFIIESHIKPAILVLPLPSTSTPTLNVHSKGYPRIFVGHIGHADSRDDLQQVGGNSSVKSSYTLLHHNAVNQGRHGRLRGSLHWGWGERKGMSPTSISCSLPRRKIVELANSLKSPICLCMITLFLTLCLHSGADQCQGITCQLSACARDGTAADQHHDPWVSYTSVPVQPGKLQSLGNRVSKKKVNTREIDAMWAVCSHVRLTS